MLMMLVMMMKVMTMAAMINDQDDNDDVKARVDSNRRKKNDEYSNLLTMEMSRWAHSVFLTRGSQASRGIIIITH